MSKRCMSYAILCAAVSLQFVLPTAGGSEKDADKSLAPFVPTPQEVVEKILELAQVTKDDVVYDLGCGDGRIVVTAAKKYGARGVGVDLDPDRIKDSLENVKKAGVEHLVTIKQQDAMTVDLSEATVVTLYLLPASNAKLRPRLETYLHSGCRVVSHNFRMKGWQPSAVERVKDNAVGSTQLYLWVIGETGRPAKPTLSGSWSWQSLSPGGKVREAILHLRQEDARITGELRESDNDQAYPIAAATLEKGKVRIEIAAKYKGQPVRQIFTGKLRGNAMAGRMRFEGNAAPARVRRWIARRAPVKPEGSWKSTSLSPNEKSPATLELKRPGRLIEGTYATASGRYPVTDLTLEGSLLQFAVTASDAGGTKNKTFFKGWIEGDTITGQALSDEPDAKSVKWQAQRL